MITHTAAELARAGIEEPIGTVLADGGYWNAPAISNVRAQQIDVLIPTKNRKRRKPRQNAPPQSEEARRVEALYRRRQQIVEPVFANTKFIRRIDRFQRRGLQACQAEWQLIAATHNLLKLWRAANAPSPA